ncbi:hypothetical protein PYCCODRAFT_1050331 [Trametes coccinea BRFM310]|uniref:Uncharacterized protein n=1 Tax=Trametes coccinea (strain BRFM310) TaxID=1353009 RepID=A0A1Y2IA24_TRAC3|nr:hypothetical protein PYCCODRAFT_1050331 [Trametes coccinea BRFM310]
MNEERHKDVNRSHLHLYPHSGSSPRTLSSGKEAFLLDTSTLSYLLFAAEKPIASAMPILQLDRRGGSPSSTTSQPAAAVGCGTARVRPKHEQLLVRHLHLRPRRETSFREDVVQTMLDLHTDLGRQARNAHGVEQHGQGEEHLDGRGGHAPAERGGELATGCGACTGTGSCQREKLLMWDIVHEYFSRPFPLAGVAGPMEIGVVVLCPCGHSASRAPREIGWSAGRTATPVPVHRRRG